MHPTHGGGHGYGHQLLLAFIQGENDGEPWTVGCGQEHTVIAILDVVLAEVDRAMRRVGMSHVAHDAS